MERDLNLALVVAHPALGIIIVPGVVGMYGHAPDVGSGTAGAS
ncbi:MAG TPA: hypothetical protein VLX59_07305 [Acidimicrobiales bacterium]|nr:hypothetical protein [Acidimicrobiales bacterium]